MTQVQFDHDIIVTNPRIVSGFIVHRGHGGGSLGWRNSTSPYSVTHRPMYFFVHFGLKCHNTLLQKMVPLHNGTFPNGTLQNCMLQNGTLQKGTLQKGTLQNGTLQSCKLQNSTA
jgi:hypothetical protein